MTFIAWNKGKIWKPENYETTATLLPHNSCSYLVNSVHDYFAETDWYLQISQHQGSLKHENFTVSYHSYRTSLPLPQTFCSYSYILVVHFAASPIWGLQKLRLVGMLAYHFTFLISNVSNSTYFEWGCFKLARIWLVPLSFAQTFVIYANLNESFSICPDDSNCTQVWTKLFQLPKYDSGCWTLPKCFWLYANSKNLHNTQIGMKLFEIHQNWVKLFEVPPKWIKLFEVTQHWMKMFCLTQLWMELLPFGQSRLVSWNLFKFFQFMETFLISPKFGWSCPNLLKFHWVC